jgi:hypothetical protein
MGELEPGKARMTHPDPGVEDAIVASSQVPHLEHAGWRYMEGDREDWPDELRETGREGMVYIRNRTTGGTAFVPELVGHLRERGWEAVEPAEEATTGAFIEEASLADLTVPELRDLAKERGISPIPTTKAELIEALEQQDHHDGDQAGEPAPSEEDKS